MLWDGAAAVYLWKFAKKHSRSGHTTRVYFGYAGLLMLCVGFVLGALMSIGWVIMDDAAAETIKTAFHC